MRTGAGRNAVSAVCHFQKSTLVYDTDPSLSIVRDVQFGSELPIRKFATEDEAVANGSDFPEGGLRRP